MSRRLNPARWKRREHFAFFRDYDNPFFSVCADVDVTGLAARCAAEPGTSFFLASLYLSLRAANELEELRYRIDPHGVCVHDVIHGGCTVLREDETFGFARFDYAQRFEDFRAPAEAAVAAARQGSGLRDPFAGRDDVVYYSVLPWIRFTSFSHARRWSTRESIPRIVFGRRHEAGGRAWLPTSVEVHHALVDGVHVGRFLERFEGYCVEPRALG